MDGNQADAVRGVVYALALRGTDKVYIGSTANFSHRISEHRRLLARRKHHSAHLQRAVDQYGLGALSVSILEKCDIAALLEREQSWLDELAGQLYNISPTAESRLGAKMSDESRRRVSVARHGNKNRLGIPHSKEIKDRIAAGVRAAYASGRHAVCLRPQNLASFNADIAAGLRPHPRSNPARDSAIVASHARTKSLKITGKEFGLTRSAVWCIVKRCNPSQLRRWRRKNDGNGR